MKLKIQGRKSQKNVSSIYLFIVCVFLFVVYCIHSNFTHPKQIVVKRLAPDQIKHEKPGGGLTIVINTNKNNVKDRVKWHNEHFKEVGMENYPKIHPVFTSNAPFDSQLPIAVIPGSEYEKTKNFYKNKKRIYRKKTQVYAATSYKHSMLYFLKHTNDNWVVRIDDDAGVYLPNVQKALWRLETYYDPKQLLLFGGFAISRKSRKNIGGNYGFLHGGSGFMFSRAGAEYFVKHFDEWASSMDLPNDVHIIQIMKSFNMSFSDSFFPGMTSSFVKSFYKNTAKSQRKGVSHPEKYFSDSPCFKGDKVFKFKNESFRLDKSVEPSDVGYPLNDVFIYHRYWEFDPYGTTWDKVLENGLPNNAYYYLCNFTCHTCHPR